MRYNVSFDIAAIILNAMLLLIIYMRRTYPTKTCQLYKVMLWLNLTASWSDLVSSYTISYPEYCPIFLNYLFNLLYLLSHNLTGVVFLLYVIVLIRGNFGTKAERVFWGGVTAAEILLLFSTVFTKFVFYFDEDRQYQHGPLISVLYLCAIMILLYALYMFIRHRDVLNGFQMTTNIAFLMLMMGAVVFQYFFPYYLIEAFCGAVAMLMMNVALDNPAIYFYRNSTCFNRTAFETMAGGKLQSGSAFTVLAFTYDDLAIFKKKFGDAVYDTIIENTINACQRVFGHNQLYMISDGMFAVSIGERNTDASVEKLTNAVAHTVTVDNTPFALVPHFCIFRHPGYAQTTSEVCGSIEYMLTEGYRKTGQRVLPIDAEQLNAEHREEQIVHLLHSALKNDGFEVYYQPIFDREKNGFFSAEALVRLKSQDMGCISPEEFIPIAESHGMILDIGEVVFEKVCRFMRDEKLLSLGIRYLEVNLSKLQLLRVTTAERLTEICARYGVPPSAINLEITETISANEAEKETVNDCIDRMRKKGFTFSLDDYGSGCANASYLAEMPFDFVKIDKGILWKAMGNDGFRAVLESIVRLLGVLGRGCIVEGVENVEMEQMLTSLGCGLFQGYLYSRPIPEKQFLAFLRKEQDKEDPGHRDAMP